MKITCSTCSIRIEAPDEAEGKKGRCPQCKTVFMISGGANPQEGQGWISPSTGMEFVWISKMRMWVGKYEVLNAEYRKKVPRHDSGEFKGQTLNEDRQPAAYVNFSDGKSYAAWMTESDRDVLQGYRYRLPIENEWMRFAQCGDGREYPWGNNWPPVSGLAGNYADESAKRIFPDFTTITGYDDGFEVTAPVEKLWVNPWGLAGVGGNVWEACASDADSGSFGSYRGGSWYRYHQGSLRCSYRYGHNGSSRYGNLGFRLVLSR